MIDSLEIRNFKCFAEQQLRFRPLTVLTGQSSGGKSSVIQAIAIMFSEHERIRQVSVADVGGASLGEAQDILYQGAESPVITFAAVREESRWTLGLEVPAVRSMILEIIEEVGKAEFDAGLPTVGQFAYLSAERSGPRDLQAISPAAADDLNVGPRGEYCAHVLSKLERETVVAGRRHPETDERGGVITFAAQVEAWMSTIVCPIRINATWIPGAAAAMLRFKPPDIRTEWLRPANVGFGLSYSLPIVVAALSCPAGGLLIVENPEAHLHPAGQTAIGRFLARIAASGSQVVIETHSDHVLDGIRIEGTSRGCLNPEDVVVHYFEANSNPVELTIDTQGDMSQWPVGFFDQTERDLSELIRVRTGE
ncbi:DUF3696 domain-containing protein [Mycobacterium sp. 134]|uniref:DUF3696 domain-containing protein n=1 Tax=Mycobacterium sp. 134 TaxID=3400425 RepID=UPI003AB090C4